VSFAHGIVRARAFPAAAALALLLAADALFVPRFLHLEVQGGRLHGGLADVLLRGAPLLLLALGMTPVIGTGGVDLAVGSTMALASSIAAVLFARGGAGPWTALPLALACGAAAGLASGGLVARLRVQPIVATLVLLVAGRGAAELVSGGGILPFSSPELSSVARGSLAGLPAAGLLALAAFAAAQLLLRRTTLGLHVEAVGDNERAARLSGIRVGRVQLLVYAASGLCAAGAGLLAAGDVGAADASHIGLYAELDAILAVVLGGTPLSGGRTSLAGSLFGALAIQALSTTMLFLGLGPPAALSIKAAAVLAAVSLRRLPARTAEARA
jgi:ribose/xylose/arabinose/galactoside ABC-type transport system permease subunit